MITCDLTAVRAAPQKIADLSLECLPHPALSLDLAPCNYHVFEPPMEALCGIKLSTNDNIKESVYRWPQGQSEDFF